MDRLSDGYLVRTSESLYSVQSMANIRIRLIFDSSNTLVNRLGPSTHPQGLQWIFTHPRGLQWMFTHPQGLQWMSTHPHGLKWMSTCLQGLKWGLRYTGPPVGLYTNTGLWLVPMPTRGLPLKFTMPYPHSH